MWNRAWNGTVTNVSLKLIKTVTTVFLCLCLSLQLEVASNQIDKECNDDAVNKIGEHTAYDRNQDKGLNGGHEPIGQRLHVGHRIGGSARRTEKGIDFSPLPPPHFAAYHFEQLPTGAGCFAADEDWPQNR